MMMVRRRTALLVLLSAAVASCVAKPRTTWRAYTAVRPPHAKVWPVQFYAGDVKTIDAAGAVVLGTVEVKGTASTTREEMDELAELEARKRKGTHFYGFAEGSTVGERSTSAADVALYSLLNPVAATKDDRRRMAVVGVAHYIVVSVPEEKWPTLPPPLQPKPRE